MLVSGRANRSLASRIADRLNVDLGGVTLKTFASGEVYCRYEESVRGADVFIVQPICGNPATGMTANDALMELMVMVDAAVGGSAHRVIAVCPWYGYSRQDKKSSPREPITAVLDAGAERVYAAATHGIFSGDAWTNLTSAGFQQIVVTDTVPLRPGAPENVRTLSVAGLLTASIRQIFTDGSVSDVFGGENQLF